MSDNPTPIQTFRKLTLGDRIRGIANQLREESEVQIKATSRILGAAAQIAQNHDQLIDEVVEMVEEDLDQQAQSQPLETYTAEKLQKHFKNFKEAKSHFNVKASSWVVLASKLNGQLATHGSPATRIQDPVTQKLEVIEKEVQAIRADINQIFKLLKLVLKDLR